MNVLNNDYEYGYIENQINHCNFTNKDEYDTLNPLWSKLYNDKSFNDKSFIFEQLCINRSLCYSIIILSKRMNEEMNEIKKEIQELKQGIKEIKNNKFNK